MQENSFKKHPRIPIFRVGKLLYEYETPEKYQNTYFVPLRYLIYEGEHGHLIIAGVFEGEEVCTLNPNLDPLCIHLLEEKINGMANHQPDPNRN